MAAVHSLDGLMKWLRRDPWREAFGEVLERHLGPACAKAEIGIDDLGEVIGDDWAMTLWGCAFEDFLTHELDAGSNIVDDYLKRRGWKESASNKAYMAVLRASVMSLSFRLRRRASLELEVIALRHQLSVLRRQCPRRLRLCSSDRLFWVWLWPRCLEALVLVKPATVIHWHRSGFRLYWRWRSRLGQRGRPAVDDDVRTLIRRMSQANPLWGAPRIHGELLKLGIRIGQTAVAKYMVRRSKSPSPTWRAFLRNHIDGIAALDMLSLSPARSGFSTS